jgi:DNA-binding MarR family transcriptional regulator
MSGEKQAPEWDDAAAPLTEQEIALWRSWGLARHRLTRLLDDAMTERTGLTMVEFATLEILSESPAHRARFSDISARCGLSPSRISRLADTLIQRGLAQRTRDNTDGRGALLALTEAGLVRHKMALLHHNRLARHFVLNQIPKAHLDLFVDIVGAISHIDSPAASPDAYGEGSS